VGGVVMVVIYCACVVFLAVAIFAVVWNVITNIPK
jgi:hypothetical protein